MYDLGGTELNFVHRRIIGAVGGFIGGGPAGAIGGFIGGGGGGVTQPLPLTRESKRRRFARESAEFVGPDGCRFERGVPFARNAGGTCVPTSSIVAVGPPVTTLPFTGNGRSDPTSFPSTEAVMGRYGAGMPATRVQQERLECLPGMVLGDDEVCYNRRDITNKERKWPKGRAPLLTGGDRNCITRAARAAKAIQRTEKQLQKLGMLKKPTRRAAPRAQAVRQLAPGPSIINVE